MFATLTKVIGLPAMALAIAVTGSPAYAATAHLDEFHRHDKGSDSAKFHMDKGDMTAKLTLTCNDGNVTVTLFHNRSWLPDVQVGAPANVPCDGQAHVLPWTVDGGDYHFHFAPVNAAGSNPLHVVGDITQ
ncbi:hypothetical protein ACFOSC_15130 [Streptantibioticus rubrisoli]|uniref:Uncharacterized protein n=1 Tax=Streptantibioticus rubrisoli TaxID=1387313 RepID=A0ABT1P9L0_9ACTN|nr:hypothetical protein [Streptantibioticus rubrisoli]MCQ4042020.1 hypothetical protein [Streptantibioticus rubrisoli]